MSSIILVGILILNIVSLNAEAEAGAGTGAGAGAGATLQEELKEEILDTIYTGMNQFSSKFIQFIMVANPRNNLAISPLGAHLTLALASYGAAGGFETAFSSALGLPSPKYMGEMGFQAIVERFKNYRVVKAKIANGIFIPPRLRPFREFMNVAKETFHTEIQEVNFNDSTAASGVMNAWCSTETNNLVREPIKPVDVNTNSSIVLVSAVYFKNIRWPADMSSIRIIDQKFQLHDGTEKRMKFMSILGTFHHGECMKKFGPEFPSGVAYLATFVEIPLIKSEENVYGMSMFVILPKTNTEKALFEIGNNFQTLFQFHDFTATEETTQSIHVQIPKFKIESNFDLKTSLEKLNMGVLYDPQRVYFRKIVITPDLLVTKAVQKAVLEIDGADKTSRSGSDGSFDSAAMFTVNRPFYVLIVEKKDRPVIVFVARYTGVDP